MVNVGDIYEHKAEQGIHVRTRVISVIDGEAHCAIVIMGNPKIALTAIASEYKCEYAELVKFFAERKAVKQ